MRAVTIKIIGAPFACEVYVSDDAAVASSIEEFMMALINAGIENGDADACAVEMPGRRGGVGADLISACGFFDVAGDLRRAVERQMRHVVARRERRERRRRHTETDRVEVGEEPLDLAALPLQHVL